MAFGQFKTNTTFYCPTTKGSVSSLKKLKNKILKKNSDSVRKRHCLRLSEQTGGERIPPSLAQLGLLQSLKYTQDRHILGCLKVIANIISRRDKGLAHPGLLQSLKYTHKRQTYCELLKYYSEHPLQKGQRLGASWPTAILEIYL